MSTETIQELAVLELPELETLRRDLDRDIGGKRIRSVDLDSMAVIPRHSTRKAFGSKLEGVNIKSVARKGRVLIATLSSDDVLVFDLNAHGRLLRATGRKKPTSDTKASIVFTQQGQLRFLSPGGAGGGEMFVLPRETLGDEVPELTKLGFDPVDEPLSWQQFGQRLVQRDKNLLPLLMDDTFIVGLGPIYIDEILHAALLRWDRPSGSLSVQEIRRFYRAIVETIHNAIKHRGTTLPNDDSPNRYLDLHGKEGGYGEYLEVFGRDGERSRNGRGDVRKTRIANRTHYYCDYQV